MNQKATSCDTHNTKLDRRYEGALSYAKQANPTAAGLVGANDLMMQQNIWKHQSLLAVSTNIEDKLAPRSPAAVCCERQGCRQEPFQEALECQWTSKHEFDTTEG